MELERRVELPTVCGRLTFSRLHRETAGRLPEPLSHRPTWTPRLYLQRLWLIPAAYCAAGQSSPPPAPPLAGGSRSPDPPDNDEGNGKKPAALISLFALLLLLLLVALACFLARKHGGLGDSGRDRGLAGSDDYDRGQETVVTAGAGGQDDGPPDSGNATPHVSQPDRESAKAVGGPDDAGSSGDEDDGAAAGAVLSVTLTEERPEKPIEGMPQREEQRDGGRRGQGAALGTGDLSFRIYWSPATEDIDLHVIDPSNHHIWFEAKTCECGGELDRDDQKHGGPENIYWPTGKAPRGRYLYYANYYHGSGRKTVVIEVRKKGEVVKRHEAVLGARNDETPHFEYRF